MKKTAVIIFILAFILTLGIVTASEPLQDSSKPDHVITADNVSVIAETSTGKLADIRHFTPVLKSKVTASNKIQKDLQLKIRNAKKEKISVLIQLEKEQDLDSLADLVKTKQGVIIGKFKAGKTIAANIPADRIEELANHSSVLSIWPDRTYQALLNKSVPQVNAPFMWNPGL